MSRKNVLATIALTLVALPLMAADAYLGKWQLNLSKSDFGDTTATFEAAAGGAMKFSVDGESYTFQMDGKDTPALFGWTAAWKQLEANTWETVNKLNGKVLSTDTLKLSPDGKSLTMGSKGTKPTGDAFENTTTFNRVTGESGLAGKWKTKNVSASTPSLVEFVANGADGLTMNFLDMKAVCTGKFDGKEYPASGPTVSDGWTVAFKRVNARSVEITVKQKGKELYKSVYSASADGKTLTENGAVVATKETYKAVFDRQ